MTPTTRKLTLEQHNEFGVLLQDFQNKIAALPYIYPKKHPATTLRMKLNHALAMLKSEMDNRVITEYPSSTAGDVYYRNTAKASLEIPTLVAISE